MEHNEQYHDFRDLWHTWAAFLPIFLLLRRLDNPRGIAMPDKPFTVLIVDDERSIGEMIRTELSMTGFDCTVTSNPLEAVGLLSKRRFDVLVTDISMPRIGGLDLLAHVRRNALACKVILVTGVTNRDHLAQALILGAYDFIEKPLCLENLTNVVCAATSGRPRRPHLWDRAADALWLQSQTKAVSLESVQALVRAIEAKDCYTSRHSEQVAFYAERFARQIHAPEEIIEHIRIASLLHDVGKIGVPDGVLAKAGPLTDEEGEHIRRHSALGADILANITVFKQESVLVRHHHENWDGSGYPDGLAGEKIPLGARIIRVADSMDAMLMERTYKKSYSVEKVLTELLWCAGTEFDPNIIPGVLQWCQAHPAELTMSGEEPVGVQACLAVSGENP
jgi:putative two-component system response regulator